MKRKFDIIIVGAGFYGTALSIHLAKLGKNVVVLEKEKEIFSRSSYVNQARVHTGFHYPRSAVTAAKSLHLHRKFMHDYRDAIDDDFKMLYAIAKLNSKVSAKRFHNLFRDLGAPIASASPTVANLFDERNIEGVFECSEYAFNAQILKEIISHQLDVVGVELVTSAEVDKLSSNENLVEAVTRAGDVYQAEHAFNVTYNGVNSLLEKNTDFLPLKHEMTELCLVTVPEELEGLAITVMDGPFFSCMPFPAENLYSLSHVRYTPHFSWTDKAGYIDQTDLHNTSQINTNFEYMKRHSALFVPAINKCVHQKSLFQIKSVQLKNEYDDGRPILLKKSGQGNRIFSVLGAKIDNVYDLLIEVPKELGI